MKTPFGRSCGFTLIELLIVLGVIGVLVAVAVPNYFSFQCRSKQSEAKTALGSIFTSEKSFFGEHNTFSTDIVSLGWLPDGSPHYLFGFAVAAPASVAGLSDHDGTRNTTARPEVVGDPFRYSTAKMVSLAGDPLTEADLPPTSLDAQSFRVGAAGDIGPDGTVTLDHWTINQDRQLSTPANDCLT